MSIDRHIRWKCLGLWSQLVPLNSAIPLGQLILSAPVIQRNTLLISAPEGLGFIAYHMSQLWLLCLHLFSIGNKLLLLCCRHFPRCVSYSVISFHQEMLQERYWDPCWLQSRYGQVPFCAGGLKLTGFVFRIVLRIPVQAIHQGHSTTLGG